MKNIIKKMKEKALEYNDETVIVTTQELQEDGTYKQVTFKKTQNVATKKPGKDRECVKKTTSLVRAFDDGTSTSSIKVYTLENQGEPLTLTQEYVEIGQGLY